MKERQLAVILYGSQLYGTATDASDIDLKMVFMPTLNELLLAKGRYAAPQPFDVLTENKGAWNGKDVETEYFRLHEFLRLAVSGQTMALDMLWAPKQNTLRTSPIWDVLVARRKEFLSKNMSAFMGYARSQAAKYSVKGDRLAVLEQLQAFLQQRNMAGVLKEVWTEMQGADFAHNAYVRFLPATLESNNQRMFEICSRKLMEGVTVAYALTVVTEIINDYGKRARRAQLAQGADWKALSHALRVIGEMQQIADSRHIEFPMQDAPFLLKVKRGELPMPEVLDQIDERFDRARKAIEQSNLPEEVKEEPWNQWLLTVLREFYGIA